MIRIESVEVFGWEAAIRGMRNPMNSWDKSDSEWEFVEDPSIINPNDEVKWVIGDNDLKLMKQLSKAGNDHSKFLRMINVTFDITAPLYWWKEYDTYKISTVANSCSTMHKIHSKPVEVSDFSFDDITIEFEPEDDPLEFAFIYSRHIEDCEMLRRRYIETKDMRYWRALIQLLPESYEQKRTVQLNYQVLKSMYHARKNHKLIEWHTFCDWCETLPYFNEICGGQQ